VIKTFPVAFTSNEIITVIKFDSRFSLKTLKFAERKSNIGQRDTYRLMNFQCLKLNADSNDA